MAKATMIAPQERLVLVVVVLLVVLGILPTTTAKEPHSAQIQAHNR